MRRTDRIVIRDCACRAMLATRITYQTEARRAAAAASHLYKLSDVPGLVRYAMYRGRDDLTLVELSQWSSRAARHEYADRVHASTRPADWRHVCDAPYRMFVGASDDLPTCLVIDRQRLRRASNRIACEWIDATIAALQSQSPDGLCAATFFVSTGADVVLNFAEWTSPEAHSRALQKADFQRYATLDDSKGRGSAPTHPSLTADHELGCYTLVANLESELIADGASRKASAG